MAMPMKQFKQLETATGGINKRFKIMKSAGGSLGIKMRHLMHGFRGFRMEMLGVMFFGMAIQRLFKSLINPALQLTGAMGLLSNVLAIMFLPVGMWMIYWVMLLFKWWQTLSPETQKAIALFAVLGYITGTVVTSIGQFALGVGSLIIAFGFLFKGLAVGGLNMAKVSGWFTGLGAVFLWLAVIIAAVVILWQSDLGKFRDFVKNTFSIIWLTVKEAFRHIFNIVTGVWGILVAILEGDWTTAWGNLIDVFTNASALIIKIAQGLLAVVVNIFIWAFNLIQDIFWKVVVGSILGGLEALTLAGSKLPGELGQFFETAHKGAKLWSQDIQNMAKDAKASYVTIEQMTTLFEGVDKLLGTEKIEEAAIVMTEQLAPATEATTNGLITFGEEVKEVSNILNTNTTNLGVNADFLKDYQLETKYSTETVDLLSSNVEGLNEVFNTQMKQMNLTMDENGNLISSNYNLGKSYNDLANSIIKVTRAGGSVGGRGGGGRGLAAGTYVGGGGERVTVSATHAPTVNASALNDFISRPGQPISSFNPNDTIVGFKGKGGLGGNITFSPTINITASSNVDIEALKSQLSTEWSDELARLTR